MAFTQTQLSALEAAIATGARTVAYADRTVTYNSLQEMLALRAQMIAELGPGEDGRSTYASYARD